METIPNQPDEPAQAALGLEASSPVAPAPAPQRVDDRLAAILAKKSAGAVLTPSERGYLGAVKKRGLAAVAPPVANPNPLLAVAGNPENPLFDSQAEPEGKISVLVPAPLDSALLRRVAGAVLGTVDRLTKMFVGHKARQAGLEKQVVAEYVQAVAMQTEHRDLMVENSEPAVLWLCEVLGVAPDKLAGILEGSGLAVGALAYGSGVAEALKQISEHAKSKPLAEEKK
jgi:hypothetical protein